MTVKEEGLVALAVLAGDALSALAAVDPQTAAAVVGRTATASPDGDVPMLAATAAEGVAGGPTDLIRRLRQRADLTPPR